MRAGKTILLLFGVLFLGGYIWFVERNKLSPAEQKSVDRQAFDLPMDRVDRIGIQTASLEVEMVEENQLWMLVEPAGARASEPVVKQLLARFRTLSRGEFITPADMRTRELTLADFGLEVPQVRLMLGMKEERRVYAIGSPNPLGNALYVKEESSQNIMLVSSDLLEVLPETELVFRDPDLFPVGPSEVQEMALVSGGQTVRLEREGAEWWIRDPVRGRANPEDVEELLQKFGMSRIEDVVNVPTTEELSAFEGRESAEVIRIWPQAQAVPVEVVLGGNVPGNANRCYARITGQDGLVEVSVGLRALATTSAEALRDRNVLELDPEQVDLIRITEENQEIVLEKQGAQWTMVKPFTLPASNARVQNLLQRWQDALVESFLGEESGAPDPTPVGVISFEDLETSQVNGFALVDHSPRPGRALIQGQETQEFLQVVPDVVKFLPRDPYAFVSRRVLPLDTDQVVRVQVESPDLTYTILRGEGEIGWTSRDPGQEVLVTDVREVLARISELYADQVIPLESELEAGVTARISIGLGGETPRNITLAVQESNAWVQGGSVAYVLPQERIDALFVPVTRPQMPTTGVEDGESTTP